MEMSDRGKRWRSNAGSACGWSRCCPKPDSLIGTTSKESRSRIFLLGAAGEQEENGLGASASGPARTLTQNVPLGSRVVSQKVNFLGQGNKGRLISSAVRRRTGEYPPARLLLPGGLTACGRRPRGRPAVCRCLRNLCAGHGLWGGGGIQDGSCDGCSLGRRIKGPMRFRTSLDHHVEIMVKRDVTLETPSAARVLNRARLEHYGDDGAT